MLYIFSLPGQTSFDHHIGNTAATKLLLSQTFRYMYRDFWHGRCSLQTCYISLVHQLRPVLIITKETQQLKKFHCHNLLGPSTEIFGKVDVASLQTCYISLVYQLRPVLIITKETQKLKNFYCRKRLDVKEY